MFTSTYDDLVCFFLVRSLVREHLVYIPPSCVRLFYQKQELFFCFASAPPLAFIPSVGVFVLMLQLEDSSVRSHLSCFKP